MTYYVAARTGNKVNKEGSGSGSGSEITNRVPLLVSLCIQKIDIVAIDPYLLSLVVPWQVQLSLGRLQCLFRVRFRERMEKKSILECLMKRAFRQEYLRSPTATTYDRETGCTVIRKGDHIAVFDGMVYHHGIYLGFNEDLQISEVMDNSKELGADGKSIQRRTLRQFLGNRQEFDVMASRCPPKDEKKEYNDHTITIAEALRVLEYSIFQTYDAFSWNCETFALVCTTRELTSTSEQVRKLMNACEDDLKKSRASFILQSGSIVVAASSSFVGTCQVM